MNRSLCTVKWQCEMAVNEMMGHGGWENAQWDVCADNDTGGAVPVICALKEGRLFEASGEELQKMLDEYFPVAREGCLEAFRESWEEHRRMEAEHRAAWGPQRVDPGA